jgi:hypothetical protein
MNHVFIRSAWILVPVFVASANPSTSCFAWYGTGGRVFDGQTRYMWSRTWHGPNALATPLTEYYIPRTPGDCNSDGYAGVGCQKRVAAAVPVQYGARPYGADAVTGFEPLQFERLGRVPNEMDIGGNLALPAGPAAAPRR